MESVYTVALFLLLVLLVAVPYWRRAARQRNEAAKKYEKNARAGMLQPVTLHPHIDQEKCVGCASCVHVCPESVLGIVHGRSTIVNGAKCIGHALCVDVCPVGAITLGFGTPTAGLEIPYYDGNYETNVRGVYVVGELGGIGLIKNAVVQGVKAIEALSARRTTRPAEGYDVVIVGAGPAGLAAALACQEKGLRYVVLEQDELGGSMLHYPRHKIVLTSPVDLPLYGKLKATEISKEELLKIWRDIVHTFTLNILSHHKVDSIGKAGELFATNTEGKSFLSSHVLLAIGRRGSPRKLGVPGEQLPKVMYRLIDAEAYQRKQILVVGGGDSAVEAAVGLATQKGNRVTLSYRREDFVRLKEKNEQHVKEYINTGKVKVIFRSNVLEVKEESVIVQEGEKVAHKLQNDFVFVFAGGELPSELLKKTGIKLRTSDAVVKAA
jgi:thioredoxin reductase (NADPH)